MEDIEKQINQYKKNIIEFTNKIKNINNLDELI